MRSQSFSFAYLPFLTSSLMRTSHYYGIRSVVSFLVHQLTEDDDDFDKELLNLNASWNLPQSPTSGHDVDGMKKVGKENLRAQKLTQTHSRKRIFVPISDQFGESKVAFARPGGGSHWSLLLWEVNNLYYETDEGFNALVGVGFYSFDSSQGVNKTAAEVVAKKLHKVRNFYVIYRVLDILTSTVNFSIKHPGIVRIHVAA